MFTWRGMALALKEEVGIAGLGPRLALDLDGVDLGLESGEEAPSVLACLERVVREDAPSLAEELGALRLVPAIGGDF